MRLILIAVWIASSSLFAGTEIEMESALEGEAYSEILEFWEVPQSTQRSGQNSYSLVSGPAWITLSPRGLLSGTPASADAAQTAKLVVQVRGPEFQSQYLLKLRVFSQQEYPAIEARRAFCEGLRTDSHPQQAEVLGCLEFLFSNRVVGDSGRDSLLMAFLAEASEPSEKEGIARLRKIFVQILQSPAQFRLSAVEALALLENLNGEFWKSPALREALIGILRDSDDDVLRVRTLECVMVMFENTYEKVKGAIGQNPSAEEIRPALPWNFTESAKFRQALTRPTPVQIPNARESLLKIVKIMNPNP